MLSWILCGFLAATVIFLLIKIKLLHTSMDEICTKFEEIIDRDTNALITISSTDKHIQRLASTINTQLKKLRVLRHQYAHGNRELKEGITNISHDLRTPLTAIWGYLDLLERKNLTEDVEKYVRQIRSRCLSLKQLTEELFRYSVISSVEEVNFERVNVCRVLEETLLSFEAALLEANIAPNIQMPSTPVWLNLDPSALTRIFSNIINNGIKYSDGDFSVVLDSDGTIVFSNTARELSTVEVGKLFDRFYTVDSARKSTGLGLSIAKLLVERMNGRIRADYENEKLVITVKF